ncbi:MAG TPA: AAA family ATPase [Candidatus Borkfalkia excrementipullorum]|nr:AAA family ATPase [Candidatus Borkfalkia excrementipullorum]
MTDLTYEALHTIINSRKEPDKQFYLDLLDEDVQRAAEEEHIRAVMILLKVCYINKLKEKIAAAQKEAEELRGSEFSAENYREVIGLNAQIKQWRAEIESYKGFFTEPYFARMDVVDDKEGYNSYYIGKKGDLNLEIVDWRAPLARKYYQKSQILFSINEYNYKLILRRALRTRNGKLLDFKNEYLNLKDYLTKEEIAGRDEEIIFDPYLKEILKNRKEQSEISDIIETIQEKQYEIITKPERDSFVLQGCAGSGKTMIMLHRLSFLMYNNEKLGPRDVLVITPSDSFNAFIDELSQVLELEKVKTTTIDDYFLQLLRNAEVDIADKIDFAAKPPLAYSEYIYSQKFYRDIQARLAKIYDGIVGMFLSHECAQIIESAAADCRAQAEEFTRLKNASVRVRRAVLGEIKEKPEGGLFYTKPFRELMNEVTAVEEFFSNDLKSEKIKNYSVFYGRLLSFYRAASFIHRMHGRIVSDALEDLARLKEVVVKEIGDLRRYKIYRGGEEVETYADRISRRGELLQEIDKISESVQKIGEKFDAFCELYETLRGNDYFVRIGKCGTHIELARLFYKDIVRKSKNKLGIGKGLFRCDAYVLCLLLTMLGEKLGPRYGLVFIDEGQDISVNEYALLKAINSDASFNVYGDLEQNITSYRGIGDWKEIGDFPVYYLNQNYRNTNQIVEYVSERLHIDMRPIGFDGPAVERIQQRGINAFFREKKGLKAVIVSERAFERFRRKNYNIPGQTGRISKSRINLLTVYESKGLEFTSVAVADADMAPHEKYIAYTRALKELAIVEENGNAE